VRVESVVGLVDLRALRSWFLHRWLSVLVAAVMCGAALSGCGGAGSAQPGTSRAELLDTLENWTALETPVDQALGILTQQCMSAHGLRYYPSAQAGQPIGPAIFTTPGFGSSLWLGPQSLAWRSVNGWGLYEEVFERLGQPGGFFGGQQQEVQVLQKLRGPTMQKYLKTLWGGGKTMKIRIPGLSSQTIRIGGCNTTAGAELFGSVAASVAVPAYGPSILRRTVQTAVTSSAAVRAGETRWAACVHARTGVAARLPSQLFLHVYSLYMSKGPTPAVHRRELATAVADFECQLRARLPQLVRGAALAAVGRLPDSVLGELQQLLAVLQQARARARKVFAHPGAEVASTTPATPARTEAGTTAGAAAAPLLIGAPAAAAAGGGAVAGGPVRVVRVRAQAGARSSRSVVVSGGG
jgi:hypothetical protein